MRALLSFLLATFIGAMPLLGTAASVAPAADVQEMPCHGPGEAPATGDPSASCADMTGCCAAVLLSGVAEIEGAVAADERVLSGSSLTAGFVPDPADRPPVFA